MVLTPTEVLIYDGEELTMTINKEAILRGWQETSGLWRVPLAETTTSTKSKYVLLSKETDHTINNVYDLPSTAETIRYLHASAGFPSKTT
jgi:hypothetical protein